MCRVLQISRSGYYHWQSRRPSPRSQWRATLVRQIHKVYHQSKGRYGSPKITHILREQGYLASRPLVARIMKEEGLRSITHKKFRVMTTNSSHGLPVAENLLNRDFTAHQPATKWVSDITYIPSKGGWVYLTIIMDLYDRKIIGWSVSKTLCTSNTIIAAWRMALINRPIRRSQRLIFHSDRGIQYASKAFTRLLHQANVQQSMSRKGNCWDNAVAENFFRTLKTELVRHSSFYSLLDVRRALFEYIESWYNRKRRHATLGYTTPADFKSKEFYKCA